MTTKYKLTFYNLKIKPVEIIKETKCFVVYKDSDGFPDVREAKVSEYCRYFDTREDARKHALSQVNRRIEATRAKCNDLLNIQERLEREEE